MLQPMYPGSTRRSTSAHPDVEFGYEHGSIGGQEGIGPTNARSHSNTFRLDPQMQPCEGGSVNVAFGGDGDVEWLVEIATLIYQQRRSRLEKNKQTYAQLVEQAVSGSVFSKSSTPQLRFSCERFIFSRVSPSSQLSFRYY
jgi:hypothetical protein